METSFKLALRRAITKADSPEPESPVRTVRWQIGGDGVTRTVKDAPKLGEVQHLSLPDDVENLNRSVFITEEGNAYRIACSPSPNGFHPENGRYFRRFDVALEAAKRLLKWHLENLDSNKFSSKLKSALNEKYAYEDVPLEDLKRQANIAARNAKRMDDYAQRLRSGGTSSYPQKPLNVHDFDRYDAITGAEHEARESYLYAAKMEEAVAVRLESEGLNGEPWAMAAIEHKQRASVMSSAYTGGRKNGFCKRQAERQDKNRQEDKMTRLLSEVSLNPASFSTSYQATAVAEAVMEGWSKDNCEDTLRQGVAEADLENIGEIIEENGLACSVNQVKKAVLAECAEVAEVAGSRTSAKRADALDDLVPKHPLQKSNDTFEGMSDQDFLITFTTYKQDAEEAEEAFTAAVEAQFPNRRSGDARYDSEKFNAATRRAAQEKERADLNLHRATIELRKRGLSLNNHTAKTSALIVDGDGNLLTDGLQGSIHSDEAIQAARNIAKERGETVYLYDESDTDGGGAVDPDGTYRFLDVDAEGNFGDDPKGRRRTSAFSDVSEANERPQSKEQALYAIRAQILQGEHLGSSIVQMYEDAALEAGATQAEINHVKQEAKADYARGVEDNEEQMSEWLTGRGKHAATQLSPYDAHKILKENEWESKDYHALDTDEVLKLKDIMKKVGYRAPSKRNGSPSRYFFTHLQRLAEKWEKKEKSHQASLKVAQEVAMTRHDTEVGEGSFDSIEWLFDTVLHEPDTGEYNFAVVTGNEDVPDKVELWKSDDPNYDQPPDRVWEPQDDDPELD